MSINQDRTVRNDTLSGGNGGDGGAPAENPRTRPPSVPPRSTVGNSIHLPYEALSAGFAAHRFARNEGPVDAARLNGLANYENYLASHRMKYWGNSFRSYGLDATAATVIGRWAGHTSPNATRMRYKLLCNPAYVYSAAISPRLFWTKKTLNTGTQPAGVTSVSEASVYVTPRSIVTSRYPNEWFVVDGSFDVSSDTTMAFELTTVDRARPFSIGLWEECDAGILDEVGSKYYVDPRAIRAMGPIYTRDLTQYRTVADKLWRRGGHSYFSWTVNDGISLTRSTATYVNPLATSYTAWNAAAPGFWVYPQYCGSLSSTNVPCIAWAYAGSASGSGYVQFQRSGATVATVAVTTATYGYYTTACNLTSANESDKIDILFKGSGAGNTYLYAAGLYQYSA